MTKAVLLFFAFSAGMHGRTQTIQYSKQNFKAPVADAMQLVANIAGYHHMLCFSRKEKVALFVYNNELQLDSRTQLQIKLHEYDDINIIPFNKFYFLYLHQPGSSIHELWKIDPQGNAVSVSQLFMELVDSVYKKNTSTLQLVNKNNRLFIVSNSYYDELGKIGSTVVQADENLHVVGSHKIFYDFRRGEDALKQVMLAGDNLLILKTARDSAGHLLQIIKANLQTGNLLLNSFNSGSYLFSNPTFNYNEADSSILLYSTIERTVFITKLDYLLNEKVPVTLLKRQFRNNTRFNFLLVNGQQKWLNIGNGGRYFRVVSGQYSNSQAGITVPFDYNTGFDTYGNLVLNDSRYVARNMSTSRMSEPYPLSNYNRFGEGPAVRFSLLNTNFDVAKDSVATNDKSSYSILPTQFSSVILQNKSYLFLGQQFGSNRRGLLMMSANDKGELASADIRVYDKYQYLLPQLQAVNNKYVIMPYTYKKELGLVKITWNE